MSLHQLLCSSVAAHPDRLAVSDHRQQLSYAQLDRLVNTMAAQLRAHGVGRGDRILIWSEKSCETVAGMQAALRLGAAYVPADGTVPLTRAAVLARDCGARAVLTTGDRIGALSAELGAGTAVLTLQTDPDPAVQPTNEAVDPGDLAYILYTSGSTGSPKGVCISHRNALAFVDWAVQLLQATPGDRFANHASFSFDLSVLDLYGAFAVGASVHLVPAELAYAPVQLTEFLHLRQISIWYSVPSALTLMLRDGGLLDRPAPPSLRAVLFAGEPFPIEQVRQLAAWTRARLLNLYGPTETNVCTYREVLPADLGRDRPVPIGVAASGDRVWARRSDDGLAQPGEEGELIVAGPTVMVGYWGSEPVGPEYPTGDLVRVLADGSFDYLGRLDHMVKVRGHRVEPGEVEATLITHPSVAEACAVVTGQGMQARLVAFVVARDPAAPPGPLALRRHCAERLPRYLVPDDIRLVDALPRTGNGKVDRLDLVTRIPRAGLGRPLVRSSP